MPVPEIKGVPRSGPVSFGSPTPAPPVFGGVNEEDLIDFNDYNSVRNDMQDTILRAVQDAYPLKNDRYTMRLVDPRYAGKETYSLAEQKKALMEKKTLGRRMVGTWEVVDNATGDIVSKTKEQTIMNVPYLTNRGTYIRRGTEYTINKQFRLTPGVYHRQTDDGRVEAQLNVRPGTGAGFRIFLEPSTSLFYMRYKGKKIPLYPVLNAMGYDDDTIKKSWGKEIYDRNKEMVKSPHAVNFIKSFKSKDK